MYGDLCDESHMIVFMGTKAALATGPEASGSVDA